MLLSTERILILEFNPKPYSNYLLFKIFVKIEYKFAVKISYYFSLILKMLSQVT